MIAGELKELLCKLPINLEIIVRCEWENETPNGPCFQLCSVSIDEDHSDGSPFIALDCDQAEK